VASPSFSLRRIAVSAFGPSLLFGLGEGAILPVIPLSARELGGSVAEAALVVTLIGIGSLIGNIPASLITMHRGELWAIVAAAVWCALAMALCARTSHLGVFALGIFMVGMSQAVFSLARQSYLTEAVPAAYRARALSTLGGVMRIGMFLGPFAAAAAIHRYGLAAAYGVGIAALAVAAVVAARIPDLDADATAADAAHPTSSPAAPTLRRILRDHRHVFVTLGIGVMLVAAVRSTRQAVIPLWADHLALEPSVASLIYGLAGGIDMLVFYPAGKVMDEKGRRWVAVPVDGHHGCGPAAHAVHAGRVDPAARSRGDRFRQRHRLWHGDDDRCRPLPPRGARPLPWRVAAHGGHRRVVRAGAAGVAGSDAVACRGDRGHRCDRVRGGWAARLLDPTGGWGAGWALSAGPGAFARSGRWGRCRMLASNSLLSPSGSRHAPRSCRKAAQSTRRRLRKHGCQRRHSARALRCEAVGAQARIDAGRAHDGRHRSVRRVLRCRPCRSGADLCPARPPKNDLMPVCRPCCLACSSLVA